MQFTRSLQPENGTSCDGTSVFNKYGRIRFDGPLVADGRFTVNTIDGFQPNPGDVFTVLTFPSATNDFATYTGLDLGEGLFLIPQLGRTRLTLTAAAYANTGLPSLFITRSPAGVRVLWTEGFPDWTLVSTTNLITPMWLPVGAPVVNSQTVLPASEPQQYFRLRQGNPP